MQLLQQVQRLGRLLRTPCGQVKRAGQKQKHQ